MAEYWRIRKTWNDGKWDNTQKGAFTSLESAIENFKEEYKKEGYFIFSPKGEIVYPHHELTQMMLSDGISLDEIYWDDTFEKERVISYEYAVDIFKQYSELLKKTQNASKKLEVIRYNNIDIYKVSTNNIKIKVVDNAKKNLNYSTYLNAGYFANYKEEYNNTMINFTLPVANLVADYSFDDLHEVSHKYWKERKHTSDKIYFGANDNTSEFRGKQVSTFVIHNDNSCEIIKTNDVKTISNVKYAVSGFPILLNNKTANYTEALNEGWTSGVTRATSHPFIGIKDDGYVYIFGLVTTKSGESMIKEVVDKMKNFGFKSIIKLDGGGSAIIKVNNENKLMTSENRKINNIITIE